MNKATMIIIAIIYLASIVFISVFGMKFVIFNSIIPVTRIECVNTSDDLVEVSGAEKKLLKVKFDKPGNAETLTGTMVQVEWRVLPDNASNKDVKFVYNESLTRVNFVKDESGKELGLILFSGVVVLDLRIMSTDGSRIYTDLTIWVY